MKLRYSNIVGFDDAAFPRNHQGNVKIVGAVYAALRFEGVMIGHVRKDGADSARQIEKMLAKSKFAEHLQLIMLQGIALGGFNVVDGHYLNKKTGLPVLIVARNKPNLPRIKAALLAHVPGGHQKWRIIEKSGEMESVNNVYIQRIGLSLVQAGRIIDKFAVHGRIPEPLRTAHLIAGAITTGESRGRV